MLIDDEYGSTPNGLKVQCRDVLQCKILTVPNDFLTYYCREIFSEHFSRKAIERCHVRASGPGMPPLTTFCVGLQAPLLI